MKLRQILDLEEKLFKEIAATFPVILHGKEYSGQIHSYLDHTACAFNTISAMLQDAVTDQLDAELMFLKSALIGYQATSALHLGAHHPRTKQAGALIELLDNKAYGSVCEILDVLGQSMSAFAASARKLNYLSSVQNLSEQVNTIADAFTEILSQTGDELNFPDYRQFRKAMPGGFAHRMPSCPWTYLEFYKEFNNNPGSINYIDTVIIHLESLEAEDKNYGMLSGFNLKDALTALAERIKSSDIGKLAEEAYTLRTSSIER